MTHACYGLTNLFSSPDGIEINGVHLEKYLIHCASDNTLLRSKSELIVHEKLSKEDFQPIYEKALLLSGVTRNPDFTIIDGDDDNTYH